MTSLTVPPATLTTYAAGRLAAADDVGTLATAQRGEIADLAPTFGVIGAEFLAATAHLLQARAHRLDAIAAQHRSLGTRTGDAARGYTDADDEAWSSGADRDGDR
ncbi:type VII secretion target [Gordonia sp. CPCC 206044]|uniref:type VII secretion target n=1 Tax=Gordonia sp. CPCC 206044 TaxID=3140793 RepID=UPI003AF34122